MANPSHGGSERSDYNIRIVSSPLLYLEDKHGKKLVAEIMEKHGLSRSDLEKGKRWLSLEQVVDVVEAIRGFLDSDEEFKEASVRGLAKSYGPLRFVLRALSPYHVYDLAARNMKVISSVSRVEVSGKDGEGRMVMRYFGPPGESRLMCLGRQAQSQSLPALWDLPPAQIRERSCIAKGDPCCEYELRVFQPRGLLKPVLGGALGAALAGFGIHFGLPAIPAGTLWLVLPALGFIVGHLLELRRTNRVNLGVAEEMNEELRRALRENTEAQREIIDLHQRQKDWNRRLEEQVAERARVSQEVADRLSLAMAERTSALRGVSHDMANPLTIALNHNSSLKQMTAGLDEGTRAMVESQGEAISRIHQLMLALMQLASTDPADMQLNAEPIDVQPLEESFRRRLRALVGDRGIRVSVLAPTREAPRRITVDRMVFDRVIDNLMSNATKYTERGSIVLEFDGKPGFLTVKISDTGRGIASEEISRIFRPGGSDPSRRGPASHGLGLSVVVRLLDRIGGKLEVMSLPGEGSTFWAHFPVDPPAATADDAVKDALGDPAKRVVTIRKVI